MRLALFQPDIPQNVGAAVRLAACLGAALDVIEPCAFPLSDRALKRTALDYAAETRLHASWSAFLAAPERAEGRLVLFTTKGATPLHEFRFERGDTLLFGRESAGAPDEVHAAAAGRVVIPVAARSLNVVTAAAIGLAEALRQVDAFPPPPHQPGHV